ncbi:MAG: O-antigen ligase family protein [Phycisphaerales bacterium]|nr:O-antigen ligase family protein [Phycisphaerales bacterium]
MSAGRETSGVVAWGCAGVVLAVAFVRMVTIASGALPYWFTDPWVKLTPESTITPMVSLLLDALVWFASAGMIWHERRRGRRVVVWPLCAILAGALVVGVQGFVVRSPEAAPDGLRGHFGSFVLGSIWVSAMLGAWTLSVAARDRAIRNAVVSIVLGSVVLFAGKAALNVTIEHGALVSEYRENPAAYLARSGIEPGSPEAAVFERRMNEPQATGWISLSNAFGTMIAALSLGLGVVALAAWRARKSNSLRVAQIVGVAVLFVLGCVGLYLSRSKGAAASMALAAGIVLLLGVIRSRVPRRVLIAGVVAATLLPLAAVVARGVLGDALGERSLLFRWQYLIGAARIIGEHPLVGVGADGFKSAYLQVRLPDAVEEVSTPHSVLFDWVSCLGLIGVAWCAVWFGWLARGVGNAIGASGGPREATKRDDTLGDALTLGVVGIAGFVSLWSEWAVLTEAMAGLHLVGFLLWVAAARAVRLVIARLSDRAVVMGALGSALVVAVHSQMEVTPVIVGSAGLALAMLGVAAVSPLRAADGKKSMLRTAGVVLSMGGMALGVYALGPVRSWEHWLRRSAAWLGEGRDAERAIDVLDRAEHAMASSAETMAAGVRLRLVVAGEGKPRGSGIDPAVLDAQGGAIGHARSMTERWPGSAEAWAWLAAAQMEAGVWGKGEEGSADWHGDMWLEGALGAAERVCELDPMGVSAGYRRWWLLVELGRVDEAMVAGRGLLGMDERARGMDPLRGLSAGERRSVEACMGGAGGEVR